jgi:hypothetical protein
VRKLSTVIGRPHYCAPQEARIILTQQKACPQVVHCGIKNGQSKEYPTRCAAEDDGATDIAPKTGPTCPILK